MTKRHWGTLSLFVVIAAIISSISLISDARSSVIRAEASVDDEPIMETSSVSITASPSEVAAGKPVKVTVKVGIDTNPPTSSLRVRIHLAAGLKIQKYPSTEHWQCTASTDERPETFVHCNSLDHQQKKAITPLLFRVRATNDTTGLRGISAIAWFGDDEPPHREWSDSQRGAESESVMVLVRTPKKSVVRRLSTPKNTSTKDSVIANLRVKNSNSSTMHVGTTASPSSSFCQLFGAAATVNTQISVGPVTFSSLGQSGSNGGQCSSSSTITLSASTIRFGDIVFSDVSGTVTPTSIVLQMTISNNVNLFLSGPFPDTGTQFDAVLSFALGKSSVTLNGTVDYSDPTNFRVTLTATATSLGWAPFPNVTLSDGGLTGTFTRSTLGSSTIDSITVSANFSGSWSPIPGVTVTDVSASVSNATGSLIVSLGATLNGLISIAGLSVAVDNVTIDGSVNATTGVLTINGGINSFSVTNLATFGPVNATFVYDPRSNSSTGNASGASASLNGTATFIGPMAQFFQGSVSTTVTLLEEGFVVEAAMSTSPATPGYSVNSPRFVWASLTNEISTISYQPSTAETNSNKKTPPITLSHESAVAVAPFGVPDNLAEAMSSLGISILDDVGTGTIAIGLPPSDPSITIFYSPPPNTYLFGNQKSSTSVEFQDIFVSVETGETDSFTIGGDVALTLSQDVLQLESALTVSTGVSGFSIGGYLELSDTAGWPNAFGLNGVTLYDLVVQAGIADGLPSFAVEAQASFPSTLTSPLGIVNGSVITLGIDVSATNPCFLFAINPPTNKPKQNVIDLDSGLLTASTAQIVVAPDGCQIGKNSYTGYQIEFTGTIRDVAVGFQTSFETSPIFSLTGSGYVASFSIDGMTFKETTVNLSITDTSFSLTINGGISVGSSLDASGELLLESSGGYVFNGGGTINIDDDNFNVSVKMTNCADSSCSSFIAPTFWASGGINLKGFGFEADVEVQLDGTFDATLIIPKKTTTRSVSKSGLDVSINITYSFYVEVSDTGSDEVKISISLDVKSCKWEVFPCGSPSVSASADVRTGSASLTINFRSGSIKGSFSTSVS